MRRGPLSRLGDSTREVVVKLARDAGASARLGLMTVPTDGQDFAERAHRVVIGGVKGLDDPTTRATLLKTSEEIGESIGRGVARGATSELARAARTLTVAFAPLLRGFLVAGAIGIGALAVLRVARR
jgi:hypothetical protein